MAFLVLQGSKLLHARAAHASSPCTNAGKMAPNGAQISQGSASRALVAAMALYGSLSLAWNAHLWALGAPIKPWTGMAMWIMYLLMCAGSAAGRRMRVEKLAVKAFCYGMVAVGLAIVVAWVAVPAMKAARGDLEQKLAWKLATWHGMGAALTLAGALRVAYEDQKKSRKMRKVE